MQALAPTYSDGYLMSSFGLGSSTELLRVTALSLIFAEELLRLYAPMIFRGINFVLMCIPMPNIFGDASAEDEFGIELGDGTSGGNPSNADAPIVPEEYATFTDDRKAKQGDENDIYMLRAHGFKKHRFNSKSFLNRNNLQKSDSSRRTKKTKKNNKKD